MYRVVNLNPFLLGQAAPVGAPPVTGSPLPTGSPVPAAPPPAVPPPIGAPTPATYGCPINPPAPPGTAGQAAFEVSTDPTLNCMRDARGNAICSDGMHYPPGCPHTPPDSVFTPGVTPDVTTNGRIEGQIPPPRNPSTGQPQVAVSSGAPAASSGPSPWLMISAGALGAGLLATGAYFLWLRK